MLLRDIIVCCCVVSIRVINVFMFTYFELKVDYMLDFSPRVNSPGPELSSTSKHAEIYIWFSKNRKYRNS